MRYVFLSEEDFDVVYNTFVKAFSDTRKLTVLPSNNPVAKEVIAEVQF